MVRIPLGPPSSGDHARVQRAAQNHTQNFSFVGSKSHFPASHFVSIHTVVLLQVGQTGQLEIFVS